MHHAAGHQVNFFKVLNILRTAPKDKLRQAIWEDMNTPFTKCLVLVVAVWALLGCGDGAVVASDTATRCHVVMQGDSITHQAGQTIAQFLPGCSIDNKGVDASILADVVQPVMVFEPGTIYTYSYGANECMGQRVAVADYAATLHHVATQAKGYKLIFEAPWDLTHPSCNAAPYRQAVIDVGAAHGVPVVIENGRDHIGDGIHLTATHTVERARMLAVAIEKMR